MDNATDDRAARLRLLEGWLPLAQDVDHSNGWALDGAALEALVLRAAPALASARSSLEARAILWSTYRRLSHKHQS